MVTGPIAGALTIATLALALGACVTERSPATTELRLATSEPRAVPDAGTAPPEPPAPPKELPRGGRVLFPAHRLVGYCGTPGAPALGELQGNLLVKAKALEAHAVPYAGGREILPVFELIAVVAQGSPGPDGKYRRRVEDHVVDDYLRAARETKALLLIDIQPGQSDFLTELKTFEAYLHEPDVGVALDPEWAMKAKQRPGAFWGGTTATAINDVAAYLSDIVTQGNLPEKALVFHEVIREVVKDEKSMKPYPGIAIIKSVDGLGPAHAKVATYGNLMERTAKGVHAGFKLFFDEDTRGGSRLMTPRQVLSLSPQPEYVMYE